jgi:hypothetical protein
MISIQQMLNEEMDAVELEISSLIDKKKEILAIWYQGYAWRV